MLTTIFSYFSTRTILPVTAVLFLSACGGGGGGGTSTGGVQSSSADFAKEVAEASIGSAGDVLVIEDGFSRFEGITPFTTIGVVTYTDNGDCGGTEIETETTTGVANNAYPFRHITNIVSTDYCFDIRGYEFVENGSVRKDLQQTDADNGTYVAIYDLTYTSNAPGKESSTYILTENCTLVAGIENCDLGLSGQAASGTTYTLDSYGVTGSTAQGFNVDATVIDDNGGTFVVAFTGLVECTNGVGSFSAGSGTITVNGGNVIRVDFISCDEFMVTYQGVANTYSYY